MGIEKILYSKMNNQTNIVIPADLPDAKTISTQEDSQNYWAIHGQWKSIAFNITKEQFENLNEKNKDTIKNMLIRISKQGIPMTPRLASMAMSDRNKAKGQVARLG